MKSNNIVVSSIYIKFKFAKFGFRDYIIYHISQIVNTFLKIFLKFRKFPLYKWKKVRYNVNTTREKECYYEPRRNLNAAYQA